MKKTMDYPKNTYENPHHRNLKTVISSLYGRETWNHFHLMENLLIKIIRRAVDLNFLKQCRDNNLISKIPAQLLLIDWDQQSYQLTISPDDESRFGFETLTKNDTNCGLSGKQLRKYSPQKSKNNHIFPVRKGNLEQFPFNGKSTDWNHEMSCWSGLS